MFNSTVLGSTVLGSTVLDSSILRSSKLRATADVRLSACNILWSSQHCSRSGKVIHPVNLPSGLELLVWSLIVSNSTERLGRARATPRSGGEFTSWRVRKLGVPPLAAIWVWRLQFMSNRVDHWRRVSSRFEWERWKCFPIHAA